MAAGGTLQGKAFLVAPELVMLADGTAKFLRPTY
jgi:hypothetical protein